MTQCSSIDDKRMTSRSSPVVPSNQGRHPRIESSKLVSTSAVVDRLQVAGSIHFADVLAKEPFDRVLELIIDLGTAFANDDQVAVLSQQIGSVTDGDSGLQLVSGGDPDLDSSSLQVGDSLRYTILQFVLDGGSSQQDEIPFDGSGNSLDAVFTVLKSNTSLVELLLPLFVDSLCGFPHDKQPEQVKRK